ncbi:MAG: MATE family efflux transporter, partial [Pseudomonadota bacterium]
MENLSQKQKILESPIDKLVWVLSLPAIIAMVLFGLNAFMDTVFIGQLMNQRALAGVAIAYPISSILFGLGTWAGTGAANQLSIALGKDDTKTQTRVLGRMHGLVILFCILFVLPIYFSASLLMTMMGAEGEIHQYGVDYLQHTMMFSPFWILALSYNFVIRAEGKMTQAAIMMGSGLILNLILTPIFIAVLDWGVKGAAWATNIGMAFYTLLGIFYFHMGKASFPTKLFTIFTDVRQQAALGFSAFIMTIMGLVQAAVVFNVIADHGNDDDLAFFAAANRILMFLMTPLFGLMRAYQPVAGINFGAQQYDRVISSFWVFCRAGCLIVIPVWIVLTLFPEAALNIVLPDNTLSKQDLINFQVYVVVLPFLPFVFMSLTLLPAIEEPKFANILGLARQLVFYVPAMLLLPIWFGLSGVYFGSTVIDVFLTFCLLAIVMSSFKRMKSQHS